MRPSETPIPFGLVNAALCSQFVPALFAGTDTHDPTLRLVAQLVRYTQDTDRIWEIVKACVPPEYKGNTLTEVSRMVEDAIRNGFADNFWVGSEGDDDPKVSQICLAIVRKIGVELFHDEQGEAYVGVPQPSGAKLFYAVRSVTTKRWLQHQYFKATKKPIGQQPLTEVMDTLEAEALFEGRRQDVRSPGRRR